MNVATITVKCCKYPEAKLDMNRDGMLHFRCVYCGFELSAGKPPDNLRTFTLDESYTLEP